MRPDEWAQVKQLFDVAASLPSAERSEYLRQTCANQALRQQVEDLLLSHERAASFLETPVQLPEDLEDAGTLDGRRVGPYQIALRIGSGGMGQVYKALDTRLDRTVAVKVLASHIARDATARDRFEREARAVAALNHPNICTLHDVGSQDGLDYLVMEYLDGETLAERLKRGPLSLNTALQYGIQIASALDRVHRAGIVHRDLKPGNIMLTKGGVKVLDFGLSKAYAVATADDRLRPAVAPDVTIAGVLLGTVQYMSPEQLDGRVADARSDIFAFGAVFYEMVSGQKAFKGDSYSMLAAAIREQEPPLFAAIPPSLDRVIRTCLAKDPDDRWQTARDLLRELTWLTEVDPHLNIDADRSKRTKRVAWGAAALASIAALIVVLATVRDRDVVQGPADLSPIRFDVESPPTNDAVSLALSPDGRTLTFVAMDNGISKLWLRPLDQVTQRPLAGTQGARDPFWSPDGRWIAFFADSKLKRIDVQGGPAQIIADAPNPRGGTWGSNSTIVFAPTTVGPLMRVPANGGPSMPATRLVTGHRSHRWPSFLPDGRRFLFAALLGKAGTQGVFLGSLDNAEANRVVAADTPALFVPPDKLLLVRNGGLASISFDPDKGLARGEQQMLIQPIGFDPLLSRWALAANNGVLAYRATLAGRRQLAWVDRSGAVTTTVGPVDDNAIAAPELAAGGKKAAVFRTVDGNADLWVVDIPRGVPSRFTFDSGVDVVPVWSPDGSRLAYTTYRNGEYAMVERSAGGVDERRFGEPDLKIPMDYSSDGRYLLYATQVPDTGVDLWIQPRETGATPFPFLQTEFDEMSAQFSPNGKWVAYQSNASGRIEVYVRPFSAPGEQQQLSSAGGSQPRWSANGKQLFFVAANGDMMAVTMDERGSSLQSHVPVVLFPTHLATGANVTPAVASRPQYDVADDGRFLMNLAVDDAPAPPITVIVNWATALMK